MLRATSHRLQATSYAPPALLISRHAISPYTARLHKGIFHMAYLLGIDIGTSGTKTLLCNENGKVLATAMAEHRSLSPKPGWSEQHPEEWWQACCIATKAVLKKAKAKATDVSAIGLSGQMHGSVFVGSGTKA